MPDACLAQSYGREAESALDKLAQLEAQIADAELNKPSKPDQKTAEELGYKGRQIKDASGKVVYECTPLEELIRWRLWDRTSAGMMAELGSHQFDAASIFVSALYPEGAEHPHPLRVVGRGEPPDLRPRPRHRGPRLLHHRVPHAGIQGGRPEDAPQEDRSAIRLGQRQRLPGLRRARLRHEGHDRLEAGDRS